MLTKEKAHEIFEYRDGKLFWKIKKPRVTHGKEAGCIKAKGYKYVCVDGTSYRVHRIIYLMHHGYVPPIIDHIDDNKLNNKIENLKEISNSENLLKAPLRKTNTTGIKGLSKIGNRYLLRTTAKYNCQSLGWFDTLEGAIMEAKAFYGDEFNSICIS